MHTLETGLPSEGNSHSGDIMLSHKIQQIIVTGLFLLHPII